MANTASTSRSPSTRVSDHIGDAVRRLREKHGWSQATLAAHCRDLGVELNLWKIHRIETAPPDRPRRETSAQELYVLAAVLGVKPAALLPPPEPWSGAPPGRKVRTR